MDPVFLLIVGLFVSGSMLWRRARSPTGQSAELTIALTVAGLEAARRGHAEIAPEHLVFAALLRMDRPGGPDVARARDAVEARLALLESAGTALDASRVRLSEPLAIALARAARRGQMELRPIGLGDVLGETREDAAIAALLDEALTAPARPSPPPESARVLGSPYRAPRESDRADVVLWNDDESTMEGVMDVLREACAMGEAEALHAMLTTHYEGRAVVGRWAWHEAGRVAARAEERARNLGMPLRVTVEQVGAPRVKKAGPLERVRRFFAKSA